MKHKEYVIINIERTAIDPDGVVLLIKANPVVDSMPELSAMFGKRYVNYAMTECEDTENFIFPFSEELAQQYVQIARLSQNRETFWTPDDEEFVEDSVSDIIGNTLEVNRSVDLIPEYSLEDFSEFDWDNPIDEDDIYDEDEEKFEYSEDLFDVDPLDHTDDESIPKTSLQNVQGGDLEDQFNDFYSDNPTIDQSYCNKRYNEEDIKSMSVKERHEECYKCSKAKNLHGLIDFYSYFFMHGSAATNEYYLPGIAYLYGRTKDVDTLNSIIQKYSYCLFNLSQEAREATTNLLEIGTSYPYLSNSQIDYLEQLYNNPKFCEVMDEILFDKEKLPRQISGITKDELKKTNDNFSDKLLQQTFNCFILNYKAQCERDDEYTEYFVYVRRFNNIIKKEYRKVGSGECVLEGTLDIKSFIEYIEQKYGKECSNYFLTKLLKYKPWYETKERLATSDHEWINWQNLFDIAKEYFNEDMESLSSLKKDMALLYLRRLNKKK